MERQRHSSSLSMLHKKLDMMRDMGIQETKLKFKSALFEIKKDPETFKKNSDEIIKTILDRIEVL